MEHRIQYLRDANGSPIGCIAIKLHKVKSRNLVTYQVSVLNPLDRFNRAVARQLALGRMVETPLTLTVGKNPTMYDISLAVMEDIAQDSKVPTRARKAAKLWLRDNSVVLEVLD